MKQLELFQDFKNAEISDKGVDVSKIEMKYKSGSINAKESNRLIKKLNNLPSGVFYAYPQGHPKLTTMPFVKNEETSNILAIGANRNQYPCVNVGGVTIAMHKLICSCFHKNLKPKTNTIVDHINKDNEKTIYEILEAFNWDLYDVSVGWQYVDWRIENLRWASEAENRKNPQRKKSINFNPQWVNWEHI